MENGIAKWNAGSYALVIVVTPVESNIMEKTLKTIAKTSVRIWTPLLREFERAIESSCLRRDAYLNRVLEREVESLEQEVSAPNSEAAFEHVSRLNERVPRKLVSLALHPKLTERINAVCRAKRIVRDAFFNRLLLLLAVPELIDQLYFDGQQPGFSEPWREYVLDENKELFSERLLYPIIAPVDPFRAIRKGLAIVWREAVAEDGEIDDQGRVWLPDLDGPVGGKCRVLVPSLYTQVFSGELVDPEGGTTPLGFMNCHVHEHHVPGLPQAAQHEASLRELLKRQRNSANEI